MARSHNHPLGGLCELVNALIAFTSELSSKCLFTFPCSTDMRSRIVRRGDCREVIGLPFMQVPVCKSKGNSAILTSTMC